MIFEKSLTGLQSSNLTSTSFLSVLCSEKPVKSMGKRYYISDINTIETSAEISLEESILLILKNLEKELIANLPSDTIINSSSRVTKGWNLSNNLSGNSLNNENELRTFIERSSGEEQNFIGQRKKGENNQKGFITKSKFSLSNENGFEGKQRNGFSNSRGYYNKNTEKGNNFNLHREGKYTDNGVLKKQEHHATANWNSSTICPDESSNFGSGDVSTKNVNNTKTRFSTEQSVEEDVNNEGKWEKVKLSPPPEIVPFKPTEKLKPVDEFDKKIKEIRIFLNKMSESNYDTQSKLVIDIIEKHILPSQDTEKINEFCGNKVEAKLMDLSERSVEENSFAVACEGQCNVEKLLYQKEFIKFIEKFSLAILTILSGNTFLSSVYSKLYKELIGKYIIFEKTLHLFIENFKLKTEEEIHYINPDKDYDGYCKYVKNNDNRKAMSLFIVNLVKINGLDKQYILDILEHFLTKSLVFIDTENRTNEVEEITDNIFIIVSNIYSVIFKTEQWKNNIYPIILKISKMKNKEHLSISSRVIFKYMDVQEFIKNFQLP